MIGQTPGLRTLISQLLPAIVALQILTTATQSYGLAASSAPIHGVPWPATDGIGRTLPTAESAGPPRTNRFVGIFYFLWHQHSDTRGRSGIGPYDVSKILAEDPNALVQPHSPLWGPIGAYHYWAEPLFGYYRPTDPWVLRRHAMMLADAGVDTLIFDTTNALTYPEVYTALAGVYLDMRRAGERTPQFAFMVHTQAGQTADKLLAELYAPGHFRELWFHWEGKPLLLCDPKEASSDVRAFFTLRAAHWPFELINTPYAWHWEATYPQPYGYTDDPNQPEQVNVSVAQNLRRVDGKVTNMSQGDARGRSFHRGQVDSGLHAVFWGRNFEEQWERAHALAPPFVMITGWNEWIAGRWGNPDGPIVFVDQYDQEHSRDIEPMKGGHSDHYYYQMTSHVRRLKGVPPLPPPSQPRKLRIPGDPDQWKVIPAHFVDHKADTMHRSHPGSCGLSYTNRSGRNDILEAKVAHNRSDIFFWIRTAQTLSPSTDTNWMWLLLDTDGQNSTGWEGFDFIIRSSPNRQGRRLLERHASGWSWEPTGATIRCEIRGDTLQMAVPRRAIGLDPRHSDQTWNLDFKWIDNAQVPGWILDVYASGDAAPEGRFRYRYLASD